MTLVQLRNLAKILHYSATGRSDVDDLQWNATLNAINGTYWIEAVAAFESLYAVDSADLVTTSSGTYDYSVLSVHRFVELAFKYAGEYVALPYEQLVDRAAYNLSMAGASISASVPSAYTLKGNTAILLPAMASAQTIRITHVAELPDLINDGDLALGGQLDMFHPLIAHEAALALTPVSLGANIARSADIMRAGFRSHMQSRVRHTRSIRYVPYE